MCLLMGDVSSGHDTVTVIFTWMVSNSNLIQRIPWLLSISLSLMISSKNQKKKRGILDLVWILGHAFHMLFSSSPRRTPLRAMFSWLIFQKECELPHITGQNQWNQEQPFGMNKDGFKYLYKKSLQSREKHLQCKQVNTLCFVVHNWF